MPIRHPKAVYDLIGPNNQKRGGNVQFVNYVKNRQQVFGLIEHDQPPGWSVDRASFRFVDDKGNPIADHDVFTNADSGDVPAVVNANAKPKPLAPPPAAVQKVLSSPGMQAVQNAPVNVAGK